MKKPRLLPWLLLNILSYFHSSELSGWVCQDPVRNLAWFLKRD